MNILVKDNFLESQYCKTISTTDKQFKDATVYGKSGETINKDYRETLLCKMDKSVHKFIGEKLDKIKDEIESHHKIKLTKRTPFQLLKYNEGHFFKKHKDSGKNENTTQRKVTVLIYLNDSNHYSKSNDSFEGGELIVYGAFNKFPNKGLPVFAKTGRLVSFPANLMHEVYPITNGSRYCIVCWFI